MEHESTVTPPPLVNMRWILAAGCVLALLIPAIWLSFSPLGHRQQAVDLHLMQQLARAQLQREQDRLTRPAGDNALETYLGILQDNPDAVGPREGMEAIGRRYMTLLRQHLRHRDPELAAATFAAAGALLPHIRGTAVAAELATLGREIEQQRQTLRERYQAASQTKPAPLQSFRDRLADGSAGPELTMIPAGAFRFGSPAGETGRDSDEGPQMPVQIPSFAMGLSEVTFDEYERFAKATGRALPADEGWGRGDLPVVNITWHDAKNYLAWLSDQTGFHYRLPTEQEWEFAARAGTDTPFHTGDCLTPAQANVDGSQPYAQCPGMASGSAGRTRRVKSYAPNPWGLHDMHGNVRELLEDCWLSVYESGVARGGPRYLSEGGGCGRGGKRIARGGAWNAEIKSARSANRYAVSESESGPGFGLRLVRDLD